MEITRELVDEQIAGLEARRTRLQADAHACTGAIQAWEFVRQQLEKPAPLALVKPAPASDTEQVG